MRDIIPPDPTRTVEACVALVWTDGDEFVPFVKVNRRYCSGAITHYTGCFPCYGIGTCIQHAHSIFGHRQVWNRSYRNHNAMGIDAYWTIRKRTGHIRSPCNRTRCFIPYANTISTFINNIYCILLSSNNLPETRLRCMVSKGIRVQIFRCIIWNGHLTCRVLTSAATPQH